MLRRLCCVSLLVTSYTATAASAPLSSFSSSSAHPDRYALSNREAQTWRAVRHAAQFGDIPHVSARSGCKEIQPPQALLTPDPVPVTPDPGASVKVTFIVGTDGRVHSPLILQSGGVAGDRNVLRTVHTWRYRPATCNGIPTEAEGKIEFSSR